MRRKPQSRKTGRPKTRFRAIIAVLLGCGLRRRELADLSFDHLQRREDRWAIVDLVGKRLPHSNCSRSRLGEGIPRRMVYGSKNYLGQIVSLRLPFGDGLGRRDDGKSGLARGEIARQEIGHAETRTSGPA